MEYREMITLSDNASIQPTKFRTKNWLKVNDDTRGTQNANSQTNSQIKFKVTLLKLSLCDYSIAFILVKGSVKVVGAAAD